ncbi:MAG: putative transport system ATP-binding protein [Pseudonocardiales bacterium]|jgi:putative ABC transport system ATP-binding protein|nr:putative transport system ATP-binding protein [Pseudonocardiales bacterium]
MSTAVDDRPATIEARSLYRFFRAGDEETLALQGVSLRVEPGEFVAIVGPSGSGKSTLLSCLAGTDEPDGGAVSLRAGRLSHQPEPVRARMRGRHIGLLFQSANLLSHLTVSQNVTLAQRLVRGENPEPVAVLLDSLGIGNRSRAYPGQLSGGEVARAGLAVALANRPAVLLADEPTGELDLATERGVLDLIRTRAEDGVGVLVASHSPAVAAAADRVVRIADGRLES